MKKNEKNEISSPARAGGWGTIFIAVTGLILFIYVFGPMGLQTPMIKPVADFIEEYSINANGMKNAIEFAPDKNNPPN